jgi:hypothetical protein
MCACIAAVRWLEQVVGWYHSHPKFRPDPSVRDIENQFRFQALFGDKDGNEPFLGLIFAPYDPANAGDVSEMRIFWINRDPADTGLYNRELGMPMAGGNGVRTCWELERACVEA